MNDYVVAVSSVHRPDACAEKTMTLLKRGGVPPERVFLFLGVDSERPAYFHALCTLDPEWATRIAVRAAPYGMAAVRNYVATYFPAGTPVVSMDDDLEALKVRASPKKLVDLPDLDGFCREASLMALANRCGLWGLYPVLNAFYMQATVSFDLRPVCGGLFGFRSPDVTVTHDCKEDMERTLLYYERDGRVMRFNYVAFVTRYYGGGGGMEQQRDRHAEQASVDYLVQRFPGLAHRYQHHSSPYPEIRLRDSRKKKK